MRRAEAVSAELRIDTLKPKLNLTYALFEPPLRPVRAALHELLRCAALQGSLNGLLVRRGLPGHAGLLHSVGCSATQLQCFAGASRRPRGASGRWRWRWQPRAEQRGGGFATQPTNKTNGRAPVARHTQTQTQEMSSGVASDRSETAADEPAKAASNGAAGERGGMLAGDGSAKADSGASAGADDGGMHAAAELVVAALRGGADGNGLDEQEYAAARYGPARAVPACACVHLCEGLPT